MKHGSGFNLTEGEAEMGKAEGDSAVLIRYDRTFYAAWFCGRENAPNFK